MLRVYANYVILILALKKHANLMCFFARNPALYKLHKNNVYTIKINKVNSVHPTQISFVNS